MSFLHEPVALREISPIVDFLTKVTACDKRPKGDSSLQNPAAVFHQMPKKTLIAGLLLWQDTTQQLTEKMCEGMVLSQHKPPCGSSASHSDQTWAAMNKRKQTEREKIKK